MSKKAKPQVATSEPWKAVQPYLLGDDAKGITGVLPEASRLYGQGGMTPQMQQGVDMYSNSIMNRANDPRLNSMVDQSFGLSNLSQGLLNDTLPFLNSAAGQVAKGAFDTNFNPVANTTSQNVNLNQARADQGVLNPTNSLQQLLSGTPNNPYLDQQAGAITNQLTTNMMKNVMPGIRSGAIASGQYGGSRQGIAEGNAISNLNQDLAPALTNLYGGAYENAQQRMYGTANALNDQAFQNANNNAGRDMATQQFNANLGLQNNQQQMAKNSTNLGNRMNALNIVNSGQGMLNNAMNANNNSLGALAGVNNMQDSNFANYMNALQMPQNLNWQNYQNFSNPILAAGGIGGTNSQTMNKNVGAGVLGGGLAGAGAASMLGLGGPAGMGLAGLGALAGLF